ncbi:hypothetical protein ECC02_009817 [Trypanosoma cruzi]|uniref:Uncharacterized protein n=1 Tax=Trypanosoma cruzi TaxID=5693 RepID=A0A7J6XS70_TRYCR|nr:hypothetical protein ECC02_009817 [Trypanosoma cruzi]
MESNRGDERCSRHTERAHHMRRGQQPGMHRTPHTTHDTHSNPRQQAHTHTALPQHQHTDGRGRSKQERHTRHHRMYIRRERSVVSAPLTESTHTHKKMQRTQQHKSKVTIQKEIPAHHVDCWSTGSAANIHHKQFICSRPSPTFIALHFMQARPPSQQELLHAQQETIKGGGVGDYGAAVTVAMQSCVYIVSGGGGVPLEPLTVGCGGNCAG